jgi:hypothetical protein
VATSCSSGLGTSIEVERSLGTFGASHDTAAWQETSIAALRTESARQLAQAITTTDPQWWSAFAASYRELRASAQGCSWQPAQATDASDRG